MNLTHFDTEAEWKSARRKLVTGSKAPVILGLSPYTTPLALWSRDVGIVEDEPQTARQRIGHHLEGAILGMLADEADVYVEPCRYTLAIHPVYPDLAYSPDGFVYPCPSDSERMTFAETEALCGIAEAKNRAGFMAAEAWQDSIPADVNAQVQLGMEVCDLPAAWVGVLLAGGEFRWAKVERDREWFDMHRERLLDYARRVRDEDPPEPTGHEDDRKAIVARFPVEEEGKVVPLPADAIDLALQYRDAQDAAKRAKLAADECVNKLALMLGDAETGLLPGDFGKVTFKTTNCPARVQKAYSFRAPRVWLKKEKTNG